MDYRQGGQDGDPVSWSAPSYFDLMVPGGGAEFSKVELCFVVPDDATLNLFTRGSVGIELPRSRGEASTLFLPPHPPFLPLRTDSWLVTQKQTSASACCTRQMSGLP